MVRRMCHIMHIHMQLHMHGYGYGHGAITTFQADFVPLRTFQAGHDIQGWL